MPSTYTTNNGIELIGTGEQSGTWGDTTNTNLTLVDASLDGHTTVTLVSAGTSGSPNSLPITDGAASNGRNRALIFTDGGDLGASVYVQLTPNDAKKIMFVRNSLSGSRDLILFQGTYSSSNDFVLAAGKDAIVKFDGGGSGAVASAVLENLALDAATITTISNTTLNTATVNATTVDTTSIEVTNVKAKDGTASATIANSTGVMTIASSVLTTTDINGGTIDGAVIGGSSAAAGTFTTATATTGNITTVNATTVDTTNIEVTTLKAKDGTSAGSIADATGVVTLASSVLTTTDINGGTIDGAVIGATTPADVTGTTITGTTINATTLQIAGTSITATAAELNILDGVTATTAEINILDGVTSTTAELNLVDGSVAGTIVNSKAVIYGAAGEVNATTLQIAGTSITATAAELNFVDGVTSAIQTQLDAKVARTSSTGSAVVPTGTEAQRDGSPSAGYFRFNSDVTKFEGYNGTSWGSVGGGATGGGSDEIFIENGQTVTTNYTITTNKNAMSTGPITINSGVTVTVPSGSNWVVL